MSQSNLFVVNQATTVVAASAAVNAVKINRGSNLDSSVVSVGPAITTVSSFRRASVPAPAVAEAFSRLVCSPVFGGVGCFEKMLVDLGVRSLFGNEFSFLSVRALMSSIRIVGVEEAFFKALPADRAVILRIANTAGESVTMSDLLDTGNHIEVVKRERPSGEYMMLLQQHEEYTIWYATLGLVFWQRFPFFAYRFFSSPIDEANREIVPVTNVIESFLVSRAEESDDSQHFRSPNPPYHGCFDVALGCNGLGSVLELHTNSFNSVRQIDDFLDSSEKRNNFRSELERVKPAFIVKVYYLLQSDGMPSNVMQGISSLAYTSTADNRNHISWCERSQDLTTSCFLVSHTTQYQEWYVSGEFLFWKQSPFFYHSFFSMGPASEGRSYGSFSQTFDRDAVYTNLGEAPMPELPMLGGAKRVVTEYLFGARSGSYDSFWGPEGLPRQVISTAVPFDFENGCFRTSRPTRLQRHFPTSARRLKEEVDYHCPIYSLVPVRGELTVNAVERFFGLHPVSGIEMQARFSGFEQVWGGDYSRDALNKMQSTIAYNRFADTRGNRRVPNWESEAHERALRLHSLAIMDQRGQRYLNFMYKAWTIYFLDQYHSEFVRNHPTAEIISGEAAPVAILPADLDIRFGSCIMDVLRPVDNPEQDFWDPVVLGELDSGERQFLDAEGLSNEAILAWVYLQYYGARSWLPRVRYENVQYQNPCGQFIGHQVRKLFIHWGNRRPSLSVDEILGRDAASPRNTFLNQVVLRGGVIQQLLFSIISLAHCGGDAQNALEMVMYRSAGFHIRSTPGRRENARQGTVSAFGSNTLYLPRDRSITAYIDALRHHMVVPGEIRTITSMPGREFIWWSLQPNFSLAASLNWATTAYSLNGAVWRRYDNPGQRTPASHLNAHVMALTDRLTDIELNPWAQAQGNACALMYGYRPRDTTFFSTGMFVEPLWQDYVCPYLVTCYADMWTLQLLPSHMMLPLPDTIPLWPSNEPRPIAGLMDDVTSMRLCRDLEPLRGYNWVQDGGMTFSAQHLVAVGTPEGWRYQGQDPHVRGGVRAVPFMFEPNPVDIPFNIEWMGPMNSFFADFILPGSFKTYDFTTNRVRAFSIYSTINDRTSAGARHQSRAWYELGHEATLRSLAVTYISPFGISRQLEAINEYSLVALGDSNDGTYMGFGTIANRDYAGISSFAGSSFIGADGTGPAPPSTRFPAFLANHDPPATNWLQRSAPNRNSSSNNNNNRTGTIARTKAATDKLRKAMAPQAGRVEYTSHNPATKQAVNVKLPPKQVRFVYPGAHGLSEVPQSGYINDYSGAGDNQTASAVNSERAPDKYAPKSILSGPAPVTEFNRPNLDYSAALQTPRVRSPPIAPPPPPPAPRRNITLTESRRGITENQPQNVQFKSPFAAELEERARGRLNRIGSGGPTIRRRTGQTPPGWIPPVVFDDNRFKALSVEDPRGEAEEVVYDTSGEPMIPAGRRRRMLREQKRQEIAKSNDELLAKVEQALLAKEEVLSATQAQESEKDLFELTDDDKPQPVYGRGRRVAVRSNQPVPDVTEFNDSSSAAVQTQYVLGTPGENDTFTRLSSEVPLSLDGSGNVVPASGQGYHLQPGGAGGNISGIGEPEN